MYIEISTRWIVVKLESRSSAFCETSINAFTPGDIYAVNTGERVINAFLD